MGYGGAERLILDIANSLPSNNYYSTILTTTKAECWNPENYQIHVIGKLLPGRIFGKFFALCSIIKILYLTIYA